MGYHCYCEWDNPTALHKVVGIFPNGKKSEWFCEHHDKEEEYKFAEQEFKDRSMTYDSKYGGWIHKIMLCKRETIDSPFKVIKEVVHESAMPPYIVRSDCSQIEAHEYGFQTLEEAKEWYKIWSDGYKEEYKRNPEYFKTMVSIYQKLDSTEPQIKEVPQDVCMETR